MAKGSRRIVVLGLLLLPLLFAALLRCNIVPLSPWRFQLSHWHNSLSLVHDDRSTEGTEFTRFFLGRLLRGQARKDLSQTGVSCISDPESDICVTSKPVAIVTGSPTTIYLAAGHRLPLGSDTFIVRPYPRKTDPMAMARTSPVTILPGDAWRPTSCDVIHPVPAVVFSNGGFAGNFFHDINDVIIPLFLTSGHLRSRVRLVVTDFEPWWVRKYHRVLTHLSSSDVIIASSSDSPVISKVHCFPAAVVGLKYHGNLVCNSSDVPGGVSILEFRRFLHKSLSLGSERVAGDTNHPVLVLISRSRRSRVLLNEGGLVELAEAAGFRVVVATPEMMSNVDEFAAVVNNCGVLVGVHGAGLTNIVFMRAGAVVVQIVPWGLDWAAVAYYGRPAVQMGLQYVEYHITVEESTLYGQYPKDNPVLVDPWSINLKGYNVSRPVYTDGQNLTLDLSRFRQTLLQARQLLPRRSIP